MNPENNQQVNIDARMRTIRTLWFALLASVAMYYVFAMISGRPETVRPNSTMSLVLMVGAMSVTLASFVIKKRLLTQAIEQRQPAQVQQAYIVTWALCEIPAILGMLDFFTTANRFYYLFFILAACGLLLHFPRREHVENAAFKRTI